MTLPTKAKTWTILPNVRSTFVSLNTVQGDILYQTKEFLKTTMGWTVKGSSDGTTAAMDGVDRWATAANARTRGALSTNPQSWFCLTNGDGVDYVIAYAGSTDNASTFLMSATGVFVAAATATNTPTATDGINSAIGQANFDATASGDRVMQFFGATDKKAFRCVVSRGGTAQHGFGLEAIVPSVANVVTFPKNAVIWDIAATSFGTGVNPGFFRVASAALMAFRARVTIAGTTFSVDCNPAAENFAGNATMSAFANVFTNLQNNYQILPVSLGSSIANAQGKLGNLIDWWITRRTSLDGDVMGSKDFIIFGCLLFPWDSTTTPVLT